MFDRSKPHPVQTTRRGLIALAAGLGVAGLPALAQDRFPSRALRIVVPFAAGTPPDVSARIVAGKLADLLKQPVVVENRAGASGTIGMAEVARSPADGYTLGALHYATATVVSLYPQFKADLVKDFTGLGLIEWGHNVLVVSPSLGVNSVAELVDYAKRQPASFGSSGVGSPAHLTGLMFQRATQTEAAHVPYNQFGQVIGDVSAGRISYMLLAAPAAVPQVLGGKLKALAVTGPMRNPNLKDVPTVAELKMPGVQSRTWSGLVLRSDTPKEIVERLSRDLATVMAMAEVRELLVKQQAEVPVESDQQFRELIRRDTENGAAFVRANQIKAD